MRLEEDVLTSFVFSGAPVLDSRDRLVGILGRPRGKDGRSFGFLPVPAREDLLATAARVEPLRRRARHQDRYHPLDPDSDLALFGMAEYWGNLLDIAIPLMTQAGVPQGDDPRCLAALADALLRSPTGGKIVPLGMLVQGKLRIVRDPRVFGILLEGRSGKGDAPPRTTLPPPALVAKAVMLAPGDARLLGLLGYALSRAGDAPAAEQAYRRAVRLAPGKLVYRLDLGATLAAQGRWSEAEKVLRQVIREDPEMGFAWADLALVLVHQGLLDEALDASRTAADLEPRHADVLLTRGVVLLQAEKWHEARRVLERATELEDSPFVRLHLGMAQLLCGEAEEGNRTLEEVLAKANDGAFPVLRVVHALLRKGKVPAAIRLLHRVSLPGPRDAGTWREIGKRAEETGEWALSERAWAEVLDREPSSVPAKAHRGVALVYLRRFAEAEQLLAACAEREPDSPHVLGYLALARIGQGKTDEALPLLERLEELDPDTARLVRAAWDRRQRAEVPAAEERRPPSRPAR